MPKYTILTMLYNTLKNYAQQLQWSREFAICLFNLSKLAKNLLGTLLIGYLYISDMRYKIKGELFLCQNYHKSISKNIKSDTFGKQVFCNPTIWTNDLP